MARQQSTRTAHPGYRVCGVYHGFSEYELTSNGLRVLVHEDPTTAVAGLMVTYLVGSRHEAAGYTGATHLLEHLMFKGSKAFPKRAGLSVIDRLQEKGARMNASTWLDRTNYYEVLPDNHFEFALRLEADRMRNALITQRDLVEEMPAVRSEYAMGENDPLEVLDKEMWSTAYHAHPYHHSTIGWLSDIEHVPLTRLRQFYDTYYWPNNAYVTVVSRHTTRHVLDLVRKHFGRVPRSPQPIPSTYTEEPKQTGPRFFEVRREGTKNIVGIGWKGVRGLHEDLPALIVLMNVLGGEKTSRLYERLVTKGLAGSVDVMVPLTYDPSLLLLYVTVSPGTTHERIKNIVLDEVEKLLLEGVTADEVVRTLAGVETSTASLRDGHHSMLSTINEAIAVGDWKSYFDLPKKVRAVTTADVARVARTYFVEETRTIGYYRAL